MASYVIMISFIFIFIFIIEILIFGPRILIKVA